MGEAHLIGRVVADADRPDLALLDGVGHQVHELRDRNPAGRVVVHVQVDGRLAEELGGPHERTGIASAPRQGVRRELRRDEDAARAGQLADSALRSPGAVHLGGIEEGRTGGHAGVERAVPRRGSQGRL